jgi:hypothetical protein
MKTGKAIPVNELIEIVLGFALKFIPKSVRAVLKKSRKKFYTTN